MKNPLEPHERADFVWKKIEQALLAEIDACRRKNDADLDEGRTTRLRARIALCKELLAQPDEPRVADD